MEISAHAQEDQEKRQIRTPGDPAGAISLSSDTAVFRSFVPVVSYIPTLPVFPVDDIEASGFVKRNQRQSFPSLLERSSSSDAASYVVSQLNMSNRFKHDCVWTMLNTPECIQKAINTVRMYPIMDVKNTAFVKLISSNNLQDTPDLGTSVRSNISTSANEQEKMGSSAATIFELSDSQHGNNSVALVAANLKRAYMWETIIVDYLVYSKWLYLLRRLRLRSVLQRLMLPVILRKLKGNGVILKKLLCRVRRSPFVILDDNEGEKLEVGFIKKKLEFLSFCCNLNFFEEISESVLRYRYFPGSAIVTVGSPAQDAMYILVSGKCDAIVPAAEGGKQSVKRIRLMHGESFGGIYGGREVFTRCYRAISECIVLVLQRKSFEMIFDRHADDSMRSAYLKSFKEYNMEQLLKNYPLLQCMSRIPIYRLLDMQIEKYAEDFTPLVLTKGDVLFNQGDPPGSVYCLLEGQVERAQLGADMTYDSGTTQILSPNDSDNSFALSTRFVLLGDEPHILPAPSRYRCTVVSRCALFFKIDGERFVNALLDDAKLFLQIRAKLTTQTCLSMKLSSEAILSVPLFREWPRPQINAILNSAEPRLVDRSISICEPAQPIREIFLLTAGGVRDPRQFDNTPLQPSLVQKVVSDVSKGSLPHKQGAQTKCHNKPALNTRRESGNILNTCSAGARGVAVNGQSQLYFGSEEHTRNWNTHCIRWSLFRQEGNESRVVITYPDENQDLSPPLPPNPAKNILYAIGGGWEGLLVDKWPSGWETTTTVELWAVPTLTIRTEFNNMPKALQSVVLQGARAMQMTALGLSTPLIAKLPPMSVFASPEKRINKPGLGMEKNVLQERSGTHNKSVTSYSRKHVSSGHSYEQYSATTGSKKRHTTADVSTSQVSTLSESSAPLSAVTLNYSRKVKTKPSFSPKTVTKKFLKRPNKDGNKKKVVDHSIAAKTARASPVDDTMLVVEVQKPKAKLPPLLFPRRRISKSPEKLPTITPELCAIYTGQQPDSCIVRESQIMGNKRKLAENGITIAANQEPSWPVLSDTKNQWFRSVPSFVPLPGRINNKNNSSSVPSFVQNSALMIKREKGYDDVLSSQANYFFSLAHRRREKEEKNGQVLSQFSKASDVAPLRKQEVASIIMSRPIPGRHAYRF